MDICFVKKCLIRLLGIIVVHTPSVHTLEDTVKQVLFVCLWVHMQSELHNVYVDKYF